MVAVCVLLGGVLRLDDTFCVFGPYFVIYEFVDKIGFTPVETITCATLNGAKMCHIEDETGSCLLYTSRCV